MSRAIALCALIAVSTAAPAIPVAQNLEADATEEPAADPDPADAAVSHPLPGQRSFSSRPYKPNSAFHY